MATLTYSIKTDRGAQSGVVSASINWNYTVSSNATTTTVSSQSVAVGVATPYSGINKLEQRMSGAPTHNLLFNGKNVATASLKKTDTTVTVTGSASIAKTHSAQKVKLQAKCTGYFDSVGCGATIEISVPAKTSYAVTYNANGGSGAPAQQTKWHDEKLTLSSTKPTRANYTFQGWATTSNGSVAYSSGGSYTANAAVTLYAVWKANTYTVSYNANSGSGAPANQSKIHGTTLTLSTVKPTKSGYTFKGWATSTAIAGAGTVNYASGASYTTNAALSLFAVWELTYRKPIISGLKIERCDANGDNNDEGAYARVMFSWSVFTSTASRYYGGTGSPYASNSATTSIMVGDITITPTLTGSSGNVDEVIGDGSYDTDTDYRVLITVTDTQSEYSDKTTTLAGTLVKAFFPMDFNADASAVGFFMPAPDDGDGMYLGKQTYMHRAEYGAETFYRATRLDTDINVSFGIGASGINHGVYSHTLGKWLIYGDSEDVYLGLSRKTTTSITDVIAVDSANATISSVNYTSWGKIAQVCIAWTNKNAISVPASGNITNFNIGTLVAGKRPAILTGAWSNGDLAGAAWYNIGTGGVVNIGACEGTGVARTIAAGTSFYVYATYILP